MAVAEPIASRKTLPMVAALWLILAISLAWITYACLLGHVEHRLAGGRNLSATVALSILPAPVFPWPGELQIRLLEDGRPLSPRVDGPRSVSEAGGGAYAAPVRVGSGLHRYTALYFTASDGTVPLGNGRTYTARYPRRGLPGSFALLLACWVILPLAAVRASKMLADSRPDQPAPVGVAAWSVFVSGFLYTLFALQAWLPPSNAPWLLAVVVAGVAPFLASLPAPRGSLPGWLAWLAGILVWVLFTSLGGSSYASPPMALGFLAISAGGVLLYFGARGVLEQNERHGPSLTLVLFTLTTGLSLARAAGFDLAGGLASLELSSLWWERIENLWTSKFLGHWLLVTFWCTLAAFGSSSRSRRSDTALVSSLVIVAIWLTGSKSALVALLLSIVVAGGAILRPRAVRRLVVVALVLGVLSAPLLAAVPWRVQSGLPGHLADGPLGALEMDVRGGVWEFSRRLISLHPVHGWGFGASAHLPGGDLPIAEALGVEPASPDAVLSRHPVLAGGHPHNAALLTWLDLGLIGALLVAGLLVAVGRSIAGVEEHRRTHAALLGLLTVTATFLIFNYPVWEPEVASILWMSAVLAAAVLPAPAVPRRALLRSGAAVLLILAIGCFVLVFDRASRWLTVRDIREGRSVLGAEAGTVLVGGEARALDYGDRLDAGAELVAPGPGGGRPDEWLGIHPPR
jgi:O-antigen ligase